MVFPALTPDFKESIGLGGGNKTFPTVKYVEVEVDMVPEIAEK